jgi:hypothetical protein
MTRLLNQMLKGGYSDIVSIEQLVEEVARRKTIIDRSPIFCSALGNRSRLHPNDRLALAHLFVSNPLLHIYHEVLVLAEFVIDHARYVRNQIPKARSALEIRPSLVNNTDPNWAWVAWAIVSLIDSDIRRPRWDDLLMDAQTRLEQKFPAK